MDPIDDSITSTVKALESEFESRWGVWLSDTGQWWASLRDSLSTTELAAGCVPFVRAATPDELKRLVQEQEALRPPGTEASSPTGAAGPSGDVGKEGR